MEDTIVAVATSVGVSAINIIRLSGKNSIEIVNKIFKGKNLIKVKSNTINYGHIFYNNEIIDEVLVSIFRAPKSYTTENMVEINCHGGLASVNKILKIILELGIRIAEPGEFLKRAFLNGRIDLIEAESVQDLIESNTDNARKMSLKGINGEISSLIKNLRNEILNIVANIEVNIDYPEYEDAIVITNKLIKNRMKLIDSKVSKLIKDSDEAKIVKSGVTIAIIGKPNAGKSSLLNALIKEEKAIVTEFEGTTRDIVEGSIILNGININFIDTAGIRKTKNIVEKIGVKKSKEVIKNSDLVLIVLDASKELTSEDIEVLKITSDKPSLVVLNKIDLEKKIKYEGKYIQLSAINNLGIEKLKNKIIETLNIKKIESSDFTYISNARQINILKECQKIIKEINNSIKNNTDVDLIEIDLRNLWNKLGEITGEIYEEELLDKIFSNFCLGK